AEVDRERPPPSSVTSAPKTTPPAPPPTDQAAAQALLVEALTSAEKQAAELVATLPAHRAGLVGSVAAACASLTGGVRVNQQTSAKPAARLPAGALAAAQSALGAEHAAIWVYGLVSAFLPEQFGRPVDEGTTAHRTRREATEQLLAEAGETPRPPEPAYVAPQPVTDQPSALAVLIVAETDTAVAWRAVLERTTDRELRGSALGALTDAAVRAAQWRVAAGETPATRAFPGQPD
ncbi:ferritin-like domain-containing protein, partial [Actinophytocola sediminis]